MRIDVPVLRFGLRQILRTRKFLIALLVGLIPLAAGVLMFVGDALEQDEPGWRFRPDASEAVAFVVLSGTLPFVALLLAGGMIADDVEDRTLTYLLVRPVPRASLYLSRLLPVAAVTAALGALQVLLLGLLRLLSWGVFGRGERVLVSPGAGSDAAASIDAGAAIAAATGAGMLAAVLLGALLAAVFGFVSLVLTRFHLLANLILLLAWELPFGHLGGGGGGFFTGLFHALAVMGGLDPARDLVPDATHPAFSVVWLLVWVVAWAVAGAVLCRRRDFNVTSAAS